MCTWSMSDTIVKRPTMMTTKTNQLPSNNNMKKISAFDILKDLLILCYMDGFDSIQWIKKLIGGDITNN